MNHVKPSPGKGRGIFAAYRYHKGDVVEVAPVIILSAADARKIDKTMLAAYVYGVGVSRAALALGQASLYNHSNRPNAKYTINARKQILRVIATDEIYLGDEILINYGYDPTKY